MYCTKIGLWLIMIFELIEDFLKRVPVLSFGIPVGDPKLTLNKSDRLSSSGNHTQSALGATKRARWICWICWASVASPRALSARVPVVCVCACVCACVFACVSGMNESRHTQ